MLSRFSQHSPEAGLTRGPEGQKQESLFCRMGFPKAGHHALSQVMCIVIILVEYTLGGVMPDLKRRIYEYKNILLMAK